MKAAGAIIILWCVLMIGLSLYCLVRAEYDWDSHVGNMWSLADKASTIKQKSQYVDKFAAVLNTAGLEGSHNALFYQTPDNGFNENFAALESLKGRLRDIEKMDENSFQYQSAIQQITEQEFGDHNEMVGELKGNWMKHNHYWIWNPFWPIIVFLGIFFVFSIGMAFIATG